MDDNDEKINSNEIDVIPAAAIVTAPTPAATTTTTTPSPSFAGFDVNKFLKKTFSDYNLASTRDFEQPSSSTSNDRTKNFDNRLITNERVPKKRRAGSVPTKCMIDDPQNNNDDENVQFLDANTTDQLKENRNNRGEIDSQISSASNRRGRLRNRDRNNYSVFEHSCAYCGDKFLSRQPMKNKNSTNRGDNKNLYCDSCTNFFRRHSPSELQRRIAYEEMTKPTGINLLKSSYDQSILDHPEKETVPLLTDALPNSNKVVIVSNPDSDIDRTDENIRPNFDESNEINRSNRYRRQNNRSQTVTGSGSGRVQMKVRQIPPHFMPLSRHHQQQQMRNQQRSNQGRENNNSQPTKSNSALPNVVIWGKENSRRSSWTSMSSLNRPTCRICHLYGEPGDTLVSPCRCAGTMQYVHTSCLVHWLEISTKKVLPSPQCELCGYHYRTHHCYKFRRMHAPTCNKRDRILHFVFGLTFLIMIGCATLSAIYLRQDKAGTYKRTSLNSDDIIVIASALLFFCAFFVAVFTQYRAETSICRLCLRCWLINRHWRVKDYDRNLDYERHHTKTAAQHHSSFGIEQI